MPDLNADIEQERIWIIKAKKDITAFKPLYEKYYDALFRFFVRRTDDEEICADLCSTTFFKALDSLSSYQWQGKPFGAWLFKIGQNELRKHYRDRKPIFVIEQDKLNCCDHFQELSEPDYLQLLITILDELPEDDLRLLELKFFEMCSFEEISTLMGIGISATKMRLYRLLDKLKKRLIKEDDKARL
ncbi:RNA polymerase sigma factor [Ekhidna sp.]|uniref:RNA polymerase sigma factor n=1 Tax=Ekhidna sp. TaxID=2608089 RepID=UPI003B50DB3C